MRTALALLALAAGACEAGPAPLHHRRDPGALVIAQPADITSLDLVRVVDTESIEVGEIVFEGLARWVPGTTDVVPGLARRWDVSADGLQWTFALRSGVTFHDGRPLDAAAVVFSFDRVLDPHHPSYIAGDDGLFWRQQLKPVKRVFARDAATVVIEVERPYAPLLGELAMFPIVSPAAVQRWGTAFAHHPVGTGPFMLEAWDPGEQVVLRRFDAYWGEPPALERLVFRVVVDARQRLIDLQSGAVDLAAAILPDEQSFVELHPDLVLHHKPVNAISYLAFHTQHPPFDDVRVRRALSHAVNKEPIVKLAYQGRAVAADSPLPPGQWGYHKPASQYAYDPAEARAELARLAAEHVFDPDRTYKLYAPTTPRTYLSQPERVARYLQTALAQVGLRTELVLSPVSPHVEAVSRGEHDLALIGWTGDTGDPDNFLYTLLHSDNAVPGPAQNVAFFRDPAVDALLVRAQTTNEPARREALYAEVQDRVADEAPWVPIACSELVIAARADIDRVILSPLGHPLYALIRRKEPR